MLYTAVSPELMTVSCQDVLTILGPVAGLHCHNRPGFRMHVHAEHDLYVYEPVLVDGPRGVCVSELHRS